jgi:hypothetical protein
MLPPYNARLGYMKLDMGVSRFHFLDKNTYFLSSIRMYAWYFAVFVFFVVVVNTHGPV